MKKSLYFCVCFALFGCSSTPEINTEIPMSIAGEFQQMAAEITESGGLSTVGIATSKSLYIATNKATSDGRIKLANLLELKLAARESDGPVDPAQTIIANHIQSLAAKKLKYETIEGLITAYALMELSPQVLDKLGLR